MVAEVEQMLATFLEAYPDQVKTWDAGVITRMTGNPQAFEAFKAGDDTTKWHIYISLRHPVNTSHATARFA